MNLSIHAHSQYYGVIGDPIGHSLSPIIHLTLYQRYHINALYLPFRIAKGGLAQLPVLLDMLPLRGFNVTMPHKQDIFSHLDVVDPTAQLHQSVNTVCIREGRWIGYSTDAPGFSLSLAERGRRFAESAVVFLGAGGVASTLALQAMSDGASSVTLVARNPEKAHALSRHIERQTGRACQVMPWTESALYDAARQADILINTTPLGMEGCAADFENLDFLRLLPQRALVCDLIYAPMQTTFLQAAAERGLETANGLDMLIGQAFVAFQHFVGILPGPTDRAAIQSVLLEEGVL